jgi:hypothetical protein
MARREMKRPPAMGEMKRIADAQAPTLRAELRAVMRLDGLVPEEVARLAGLDVATLAAFLEGASINPRWQEKLAQWVERAGEGGRPSSPAAPPHGDYQPI